MILSGAEINWACEHGDITIVPFLRQQLNPNSYNYRLGQHVERWCSSTSEGGEVGMQQVEKTDIPSEGCILWPGSIYLAHTLETLGSCRYAMTLLGRSSIGRLGLFLNVTADLGHVGSNSQWTLELTVVQPLRVYKGMQIGQIAFWEMVGPVEHYQGRYAGDLGPVPNRDKRLQPAKSEDSKA